MVVIYKVEPIQSKTFRYRVYLSNTATFDCGCKKTKTYIDGASELEKQLFWEKTLSNKIESLYVEHYIPSEILFTCYLLWGNHRSLKENIIHLNSILIKLNFNISSYRPFCKIN